jgi:hypothetical protein
LYHKDNEMNEDVFNGSIRKFLKTLGVSGQREIEKAVRQALAEGKLKPFLPEAGGVIERQSCFFLASRCRAQSLLAISSTSCGRKSSPVSSSSPNRPLMTVPSVALS